MTMDELEMIYHKAASSVSFLQYEGPNYRAGIRAVVAALRDEMSPMALVGMTYEIMDLRNWFDEILASDGGEPTVGQRLIKAAHEAAAIARGEAAGGSTSNDGRLGGFEHPSGHSSPAADKYTMCRACGHPYIATMRPPEELQAVACEAVDVCEWTKGTRPDDGSHYETACGDAWCSVLGGTPKQDNYSFCPSCGKPISFKEAP